MPFLKIKNVKKGFKQPRKETLEIPDFQLEVGEWVAIQGPTGSGKSTFLNLISGLIPLDSGEIWIGDTLVSHLSEVEKDRFRALNIGCVFSSSLLLDSLTVRENMLLGGIFNGCRDLPFLDLTLERLSLKELKNVYPRELSISQKRKVVLGRALLHTPKLVLADDPTSGLDLYHSLRFISFLQDSCQEFGAALLVASHDSNVISQFKQVKIMSQLAQKSA